MPACPYCRDPDHVSPVWGLGNLGKALLVIPLYAFTWYFASGDPDPPGLRWNWRCRTCGARFVRRTAYAEKTQLGAPPPTSCGVCRYELTANKSGFCPECGWRIPEAMQKKDA